LSGERDSSGLRSAVYGRRSREAALSCTPFVKVPERVSLADVRMLLPCLLYTYKEWGCHDGFFIA
jgi:hypothetical protein